MFPNAMQNSLATASTNYKRWHTALFYCSLNTGKTAHINTLSQHSTKKSKK